MFKFLKEKLKSAISIFKDKAETEAKPVADESLERPKPEILPVQLSEETSVKVEMPSKKPVEEIVVEKKPVVLEKPLKEKERVEKPKAVPALKQRIEDEQIPKPKEIFQKKPDEKKQISAAVLEIEPSAEMPAILAGKIEPKIQKTGFFHKLKEKFSAIEKPEEAPVEKKIVKEQKSDEIKVTYKEKEPVIVTKDIAVEEEKPGFFSKLKEKVQSVTISEQKFDEMFWDLEVALLENNVAVEVIEKIKQDLKKNLVEKPLRRGAIEKAITDSLTGSIKGLFEGYGGVDLVALAKKKKPFVICFVGVNGSGKTTTIAKVAYMFQQEGMSVVLAAADTFRAAAIDQLQLHADKLGVKLIKQDYGSDAAAVAFDAIKHAEAKQRDVVLIDTAGRLHSNANLMDEMKKVVRVAKPDMVIFVGESITGNDCVEQARIFGTAVRIDGIILSKADIDEKGGAAISISHVTHKPILYIGTGQEYQDLKRFDPDLVVRSLGLEA